MKSKLVTLASLTGAALLSASALVMAQPAHTMNMMSDQEFGQMFTEMDTNKDGMISRAEYVNYHMSF